MPLLRPDPTFYPSPLSGDNGAGGAGGLPQAWTYALRSAWINLDWMWAGALVVTGCIVLVK
jgi:hypothetical protein